MGTGRNCTVTGGVVHLCRNGIPTLTRSASFVISKDRKMLVKRARSHGGVRRRGMRHLGLLAMITGQISCRHAAFREISCRVMSRQGMTSLAASRSAACGSLTERLVPFLKLSPFFSSVGKALVFQDSIPLLV